MTFALRTVVARAAPLHLSQEGRGRLRSSRVRGFPAEIVSFRTPSPRPSPLRGEGGRVARARHYFAVPVALATLLFAATLPAAAGFTSATLDAIGVETKAQAQLPL